MNTSSYQYDQLNRLKSMDAWSGYSSNSWNSVLGPNNTLNTTYSYTANGNITALSRKANLGNLFDDLSYSYTPGTNRLTKVNDSAPFDGSHDDIEDQTATTNYTYDASGNMIGDAAEGLTIAWNYLGKVDKVTKANNNEILFRYDGMGHRVVKIDRPAQGSHETQTIYFRDASGNVMAVYEYIVQKPDAVFDPNAFMEYSLEELHIYGSSRIGLLLTDKLLDSSGMAYRSMPATLGEYNHWIAGNKRYELTNHLGNVLSVVSDRKIGHSQFNTLYFSYYTPDIRLANDYYPFGWAMPGRQVVGEYRYGFGGHEKDDEVKGDGNEYATEFRQYDPRLGRWMAVDKLASKYPHISPYASFGNNPVLYIDIDGKEIIISHLSQDEQEQFKASIQRIRAENVYFDALYNMLEISEVQYFISNGNRPQFQGSFASGVNHKGESISAGGNIDFRDISSISVRVAMEEFFHGLQYEMYVNKGPYEKLSEGGANIEFEAKFLEVLSNVNLGYAFGTPPGAEGILDFAFDLEGKYELNVEHSQQYFEALNGFIQFNKELKDEIEISNGNRPKDFYDAPATDQKPDAAFKVIKEGDKKRLKE